MKTPTDVRFALVCASVSASKRTLTVQPELLFMDETFHALDVLTAQNLRTELLRLCHNGNVPTTALIMITQSLEDAVTLSSSCLNYTAT